MAALGPVFIDTSVLVAGVVDLGEASAASQRLLDAIAEGGVAEPMTAWHCCLELYSVLTRLPVEYRVEAEEAAQLVRSEVLARFRVVQFAGEARDGFFTLAAAERVSGGRVYDLHIAEAARGAGARTVVTGNCRHFVPLLRHGIRVVTPEEFLGGSHA